MAGELRKVMRDFIKKWVLPPGISETIVSLMYKQPQAVQYSPEEKELLSKDETLKDRHKGKRCFILGGGSSVKEQDLKKLSGECVISVSNTFVHPDYHIFKPKYHVLPPLIRSHGELYPQDKFVEWLKEMETKTGDAEMFFHIDDRNMIDKNDLFKNRIIHWTEYCHWDENSQPAIDLAKIPEIWSVSELAITIAIYLGFDKIYLLGLDHDWFKGLHVYFYDEKKEHILQPDKSKLDYIDSEFQMRRHAYIFKKYKYLYNIRKNIYNANADPNTYVDVFPKVDYESLFMDKTAVVG